MAHDPHRRAREKKRRIFFGLKASPPAENRSAERTILNPLLAVVLLGFEANRVIHLRIMKIARGGEAARQEAFLMVDEKVLAALEAWSSLFAGHGAAVVINRYREHVAANARRLAATPADVGTVRRNAILRCLSVLRGRSALGTLR